MNNLNDCINYKIEKECFFKWVNFVFCQHKQPLINNINYDLRDGAKLLSIIQILSKNNLTTFKENSSNQKWNNIDRCFDILQSHDIDTDDIKAVSILDGNLKSTLNLIWKIIMFWQIKRPCELESLSEPEVKGVVLQWCNKCLKKYGLSVSNFGSDWRNGLAFNALLHSLDPEVFDFEKIKGLPSKEALAHAFKLGLVKYGIPQLLEPLDVDRDSPDSKCLFLYIALIYEKSLKSKGALSSYVTNLPEYSSRLDNLMSCLKSIQSKLCEDKMIPSEIDDIKDEFNRHEDFITSLTAQQTEIFDTLKAGQFTLQNAGDTLSKDEKGSLLERMKGLNALWESVRTDTLEYQARLQKALDTIQKEQMATFETWLDGMEKMRNNLGSDHELSFQQGQNLKKEFDKGTALIKPLSNLLVIVDSEEDQGYDAFEEKLTSLRNRYTKISSWAENLKNQKGEPILVPVFKTETSDKIAPEGKTYPSDLNDKFKAANDLKDWNTIALSKLEILANYHANPSAWKEMGEDPQNLPSLEDITHTFESKENLLKDMLDEYNKNLATHTPDLDFKKQLENVERTMNYIKYKIEKLEAANLEFPSGGTSAPSYKKMKVEPSHSFKGRPLAAAPLLSPIDMADSSSPTTTILTPVHEGSTSPPPCPAYTPPPPPAVLSKPGPAFNFARVPSIEITSDEPDKNEGGNEDVKRDVNVPSSVEHILSRKRESLSVPSEFPELTIPAVESEQPGPVHLSKEPYASHDIERIHIDIYDINEMLKELEAWFMHAKEQAVFTSASQTKAFSDAIENCSTKLDNIKALWPKIEETRNQARQAVSQSGDETYQNILHDANNMIHRWEGLFEQTNQYFETLVNMLEAYHYQSFQEPLTSLNRWLDNVQSNLIAESNKYNDPDIMQENLKKLQDIQQTIHGQSPNLTSIRNIWEEKMSDENFHFSLRDKFQKDIDEVVQKFGTVCQLGDESSEELEKRLVFIRNYLDEVKVLRSWMDDLNKILESDQDDVSNAPKLKEEELKGLQDNLDLLRPNLDNINKVTPKILENCDIDFAKKIKEEVHSLNELWKKIIAQSDKEKTWFNFDGYMQYLDRVGKQLDVHRAIETERDIDNAIETLKNLKNDLNEKKYAFYNDLPSGLFPQGTMPDKEEKELNIKYCTLIEKIDSLIDFYQTSQQDYMDFKANVVKTNEEIDAINLKLQAASKDQTASSTPGAQSLSVSLNRKLSGLKDKAQILGKNKIFPQLLNIDIQALSEKVNDVNNRLEKDFKQMTQTDLRPPRRQQSPSEEMNLAGESPVQVDDIGARLDANILKLQEWIVHEDILIMSHMEGESPELSSEEYAQMVKDFKDKDALFRSIEKNLNLLPDRVKAREMGPQLKIMKTRFKNVQATFEDLKMPPQIAPRLKRIRLSLADIKDDVEELKVSVTKATDVREQLDRCLRDCYRLGDVKTTLEKLNKDLPDLLKDENPEVKKEIEDKLEALKKRYNEIGDKANDKKAVLQTALEVGDKFDKLNSPLEEWIQTTENDLDNRRKKVNPNNLAKETNNIKQLEMEVIQKDTDLDALDSLLNDCKTKFSEEPKKFEAYELAAQETRLQMERLRAKIKDDGDYYKNLEDLNDKLKGQVENIRAFIHKGEQKLATCNDDDSESIQSLRTEMEESRITMTQAQSTGSELIGLSDNFRTTTLSELASLKKQFEDIAQQIEVKCKTKISPSKLPQQIKPQGLEQDLSFGIARLNDFAQQLEPSKGRITPIPMLDPYSDKFQRPLDSRIQALKSEYQATQELMNGLKDRMDKSDGANKLVNQDFDQIYHKWENSVKPLADSKISEYEKLASCWKKFVSDGKALDMKLTEINQPENFSMDKYDKLVEMPKHDLENLKGEAAMFKNTELEPLSDTLINMLEDRLSKMSTVLARSSSLAQYPKTPPPTPSYQSGGGSVVKLPTNQTTPYDWSSSAAFATKLSTTSAPPPVSEEPEYFMSMTDKKLSMQHGKGKATSSSDRLDYSSDPYEFLWEISNIQEMVKRMIKDLKDPTLFGDSEISKNPENYPARRERLMSIKETLEAISPGIEGSESHKNDLIKYNDDRIVSKQIEDSLENLKTDWLILNQVYNDKLNLIEPGNEKGSVQLSAASKETQRPVGSELREAAEIAALPDKFNLVDQEPPEAIELVSRLQDIALWLQKCENELKKPIPLFNESALREQKSAYKIGEAGFPSKLKVLKDSQSTLDQIKGASSLQPEKVERIQHLIEQAKDKYQAISKDYVNKRKEIDDQYNRVFHFDQQLDGLSSWLNSTRQNIEKSLPVLKEDDIKDIHTKLDKRQADYDQINYTFIQLANEGSRYNELYDIDDYRIPDVWRDSIKKLNADWDFIKSIDPKNVQKTVASEELQADQPNIQAQWPKVQQEMYQMNDKLNTIENYLTSRIVNIINIPEIDSEVMSLKESLKEVKNLKGHIIQIEKMENNVLLEKAGYKDQQIKEVKSKCDNMINKMKDRIIVLNAMRQDALKYDYLYTALCEWLRVNSPILKELVDCPDYSKITEEELRKNHVYLEQKVPTYNKLSQDIQMLSKKIVNTYSNDDPSSINSKTSNIYKLWFMLQRGEEIGPKISLTTLGTPPSSIQRQQQQTMPLQKTSMGELTPKDLKEFRNQLESFKVALTGEESALEVMKCEIGQALKEKDEAHLKVWLEQVKEFQRDLEEHRLGYNVLNENGKKVLDDPSLVKSKEEVLALKYKLDDINKKWEQLKTESNTLRNSLEEHFDSHNPITLAIEEGLRWVIDRRNHLESMKPLRGDLNGLRHQLEEVRQFNSRVEAKRDPAIQDILKNGQAYLAQIGYYKALTGEYPLSPIKLEEGKKLENELINLQSRWTELLDSGLVWENTISQMLSKVEDLNMNMVDIDITLKEKRAILDAMDRNKDAFKPNFQALSDDVEELKVRIYDLNGEAAGLLAQGLHLAKENDKRLQKLNDDWQYLHDHLHQRLASSDAPINKRTVDLEQDTSLPRSVVAETMPETSPGLAKANVPSSISRLYQPKNAIMSYRPSRDMSYMVKDPTLPPTWEKALTENGVPYYISLETQVTYWDHPKMMEIMNALTETNYVRYSAYRTAMKLRIIQKRLFLYLLKLNSAIDLFDNHNLRGKNEDYIRVPQISSISRSLYEKLNQDNPDIVTNIPLSSDLYVDWLLDVYDSSRTGKIRVLSMKVATIILCRAHLVDKYKYLIQLVADANGNVTMEKLPLLLKDMLMIPKYLGEVASFGGSDPGPSVTSCFENAARASKPTSSPRPRSTSPTQVSEHRTAGVGGSLRMGGSPLRDGATIRAIDFVTWMNRDPQSVVWLPVLYRIAAAETARHQSKCNICKAYPIVGFRYRCLKCLNFDICQQCFFLGKRYKSHKPSHPLHEYSTPTTTGEDVKDLTKTIKNKLFRSKGYYRLHPRLGYLPLEMGTTQSSRQAYGGDSSDDEEHRPLVAGPGGADDSYRASASPQSTLNHLPESNGYTGGDKIGFIDHSFINASEPHKDVTEEISLANLDEHTLINKYCQDLSNNPSPSLSKISLNTDDDNKIYFDKRIRDLELEHITLKREYERLKNNYDDSITHCINNDHQYSPNLRDTRTSFPVDDGEIDTSVNRFERLYTTSSPYNDISYQHLKTLDNLGLDDSSHPYIRLADCAWSPNPNLNPLYSVANNLNKAVGELVTAISSTNPSTLQNPKKWQKIYVENSDGASAPLTPVH